jgi:AsmA protein
MVSVGAAALLVLVMAALVQFIDINVYKPRIEAVASDALGMDFRIGGKMRIVLFPRFGVSLENVSIRKGEPDFLSARKIRIGLQLLPLLKREVRIRKFTFIDPKIIVERDKYGRFNFEPVKPPAEGKKFPAALITMRNFAISHGQFVFSDKMSNAGTELSGIDLKITDLSLRTGKGPGLLRNASFIGKFSCKTIKTKNFAMRNVKADKKGEDGIFDRPVS